MLLLIETLIVKTINILSCLIKHLRLSNIFENVIISIKDD